MGGLTEDSVDNVLEKSRIRTCRMVSNPVRADLHHSKPAYAVISQVTLFKNMREHRERRREEIREDIIGLLVTLLKDTEGGVMLSNIKKGCGKCPCASKYSLIGSQHGLLSPTGEHVFTLRSRSRHTIAYSWMSNSNHWRPLRQ